jgi:hypothetical protein
MLRASYIEAVEVLFCVIYHSLNASIEAHDHNIATTSGVQPYVRRAVTGKWVAFTLSATCY